jgi:GGDEF domain-containing protein
MEMEDESAWLKAADDARYVAKRQGRGRLQVAAGMRGIT